MLIFIKILENEGKFKIYYSLPHFPKLRPL